MAKAKILKKPKKSEKKFLKAHEPFTSKLLRDRNLVAETLLECIKTGEIDAFRDVLIAHLMTTNKSAIAKKAGIGRRTLYDLLDPKKEFNPELSTVSAVIRAIAA